MSDHPNPNSCCFLKPPKRKTIIDDSNKWPKETTIDNGFIIEKETGKQLARVIRVHFKTITEHSGLLKGAMDKITENQRIYLECARDNLSLMRIIEPFEGIEIGYTAEEFTCIVQEEKEKKKSAFKNAKEKTD